MSDDERPARFEIFEEDGVVWLTSDAIRIALGPRDKVAEKFSEWLGSIDWGERE